MTADRFPSCGTNEELDAIIAEYLESVERGDSSEPGHWLQKYPDFTTELELFFAAETRFNRVVAPLRTASLDSTVAVETTITDRPRRTIKDYDLLAEIGRGGMGIIYRARQRSLNRLVAIKMIRSAEWATPAERLRFRWEAEAIGALDHANIVPIYEIGEVSSEDGSQLPFFSMKLIEGENLAQGSEHFRNDWNAIARLLTMIARAIDHAHQRGILHRDLKPANILLGCPTDTTAKDNDNPHSKSIVTATKITPHITDFGLAAKAHQHRGQTIIGTIVGTPAYLAPELASGGASATIASDVYALGAILYELMTGEPPFQGDTPLETIRMLTTSAVKSPRKTNSGIPLDLETICLKCLERDAQQRYGSAGKLADDLELFLAGRSISARPVGSLTAFRRWCWRQPVIAGLGAALLLSIVVGLPLIIWNWRRAVEHERVAQINFRKAQEESETAGKERVSANEGFLLTHRAYGDLFRSIGDLDAEELAESEMLNKELLERGLSYYREFVDRRQDDPKMRRELASAMVRIARITQNIKTNQEAIEAHDKAIAFLRSVLEQYPDDISLLSLLSQSLTNRGQVLGRQEKLVEAIRSQEEAIEVWSRLPDQGTDLPTAQWRIGIATMDLGITIQRTGDWTRTLETFLKAKTTLKNCITPERVQSPLILCLLNIAVVEEHFNHLEEARESIREARQIAGRLYKESSNSEEMKFLMGSCFKASGNLEYKASNLTEAEAELTSARQFFEALNRAKPRSKKYKRMLSGIYSDLAAIVKHQKKPAEANKALELAVIHLKELTELGEDARQDRTQFGILAFKLGEWFMEAKNYGAAAKAFQDSRDQFQYVIGRWPSGNELRSELGRALFFIGVCLGNMQKTSESLAATKEAIAFFQQELQRNKADSPSRKNLSSSLGNSAILLRALSRYEEAIAATEERLKLWPGNADESYDAALDFARTYNSLPAKEDSNELRDRAVKSALHALQQALVAGLPNLDRIRTEPTFQKIRGTNAFQKLLNMSE